jgi:uncharacterized membrane protein (UPF0127 family)
LLFEVLRRAALAAVLAGASLAAASAQEPDITHAQPALPAERLTVATHKGVFSFRVEIARTPRQQNVGLMFRPLLARGRGMLFEFSANQPVAFWMKNCPAPIDMLFIEKDGTVLSIANAQPNSETPIPSGGPITGVLEIRGGGAAEIDAAPGDQVRHRFFRHG